MVSTSGTNPTQLVVNSTDFCSEENCTKWRGLLVGALRKVLEQVHPSLGARDDALEYVEGLCFRLLAVLCAKPVPHTVQDVEYRVQSTFPTPIDKWALKEAQEALERGRKKSVLLLPVDKIHHLLQKELLMCKIDSNVALFLVAVLEYISADILKLSGNYVKNIKHFEITYQDVQISMNADKSAMLALMDMFYQDYEGGASESPEPVNQSHTSLTYEELVMELLTSEKSYLRELHMLIKVFREEIIKLGADHFEIEAIFSNILDIYELTYTLVSSLDDVIEMAQEQQMPFVGSCFEELAEAAEFDVYVKYAHDVTAPECRQTLNALLSRPDVESSLYTAGHGMRLALKYYLPALLLGPVRHFLTYVDCVALLRDLAALKSADDHESLCQVEGLLKPLQSELNRSLSNVSAMTVVTGGGGQTSFSGGRARRLVALEKLREIQRSVDNWPADDNEKLTQCCNEFIREDVLTKYNGAGQRQTTRRVYLFDGVIMLCKPQAARRQSNLVLTHHHHHHSESGGNRRKEHFYIRMVELIDTADDTNVRHAFEIAPRSDAVKSVVLCGKNADEKNAWMADLVMLNTRPMLERILDSILSDVERRHPLRMPPADLYRFAAPDSDDNLVLDTLNQHGAAVPIIKGATLLKLVERLTYHIYADPKFVRTFLTTYRSFCSPVDLLNLLIERFHIPDPSHVYDETDEPLTADDQDKPQKNCQRSEDWKKYRKEYCQPIQFRVLNVLRHWVDQHFYDFERDASLLHKLHTFLNAITAKNMRKWVDIVLKIVQRRTENDRQRPITIAFIDPPPPIEWHLSCTEDEYGVLTLHPVEIARQLTILEFDLYRQIKPSELVGSVWTKKDKDTTSPNLLRMIKHTTNITRWWEKNIVEAENFEERVAIFNRTCEIMSALSEINNFNGVLAIVSATGSASVHRLKFTFQALTQQNRRVLEEYRSDDHFKKYQEKLRSINPPCVPFLGMYLTNILHIEEGNPDCLAGTNLVNFFKRRKVAEITGEIQQYQNQPYCYSVDGKIRNFFETLVPFGDWSDTDISNYLYNKSIEIEPRGAKQVPKFPRKWPHLNLKSPGIKTGKVGGGGGGGTTPTTKQQQQQSIASALNNAISTTLNSGGVPLQLDHDGSNNDYTVFAAVQLGGGTAPSPASLSPISPAAAPVRSTTTSQSPSPRTPPPAPPPPLPPRVRTAPPQAQFFPTGQPPPPPLPPRRSEFSPILFTVPSTFGGTLPRLHPTHMSQLHMRRHGGTNAANTPPAVPKRVPLNNGQSSPNFDGSSTLPKLPPKPMVRSADFSKSTTIFQYPSTTSNN